MKKDVKISLMENGKLSRGGWLSIVAFLLVAVIALSVALGLVVKAGKDDKAKDEALVEAGGMLMDEETQENGITLLSAVIPKEQYADYGIAPIAESAFSVTATAKSKSGSSELPEAQQQFKWTMAWAGSNSSDVNTYVKMTESGGKTATFSCLKGFSTKITVTCAWAFDETAKATLPLDYAKRLKSFAVDVVNKNSDHTSHGSVFTTSNVSNGGTVSVHFVNAVNKTFSPSTDGSWANKVISFLDAANAAVWDSVGTVENTMTIDTFSMHFTSGFMQKLTALDTSLQGQYTSPGAHTSTPLTTYPSGSSSKIDQYALLHDLAMNMDVFVGDDVSNNTYHGNSTPVLAFLNMLPELSGTSIIEVEMNLSFTYGDGVSFSFFIQPTVEPISEASVTVNSTGHIF